MRILRICENPLQCKGFSHFINKNNSRFAYVAGIYLTRFAKMYNCKHVAHDASCITVNHVHFYFHFFVIFVIFSSFFLRNFS